MNVDAYDFTQLSLLALDGRIQGRTKLQKTVYFLGVLTDQVENLGYRPHYYGPYSDRVAAAVERLKTLRFLTENTLGFGGQDNAGFEIARHDFEFTDEGRRVAEDKSRQNPDLWGKIVAAAQRFAEAGDIGYSKMSLAAKTHYMVKNAKKPQRQEDLIAEATKLGWSIAKPEIQESVKFLENLKLVRVAAPK